MQAYRADLAYIHDVGFSAPARHAAAVLIAALRRAGVRRGTIVDLGCGGGILSEAVARAGYEVIGIDLSPAMLALARRRVPGGRFRRGSLFDAEIPPCVAVAAVGECINYRFDRQSSSRAVMQLLRRIRTALAPGGLFLFDAAAPGRAGGVGVLRGHVTGPDWAVLVTAEERGARLTRRIVSFRKRGALYRRSDEVHELRLIRRAEMEAALRAAGFRVRVRRRYGRLALPRGWFAYQATVAGASGPAGGRR